MAKNKNSDYSGCFVVGRSGNCNPDCFVYLMSECPEPQEMVLRLSDEEKISHIELYGE